MLPAHAFAVITWDDSVRIVTTAILSVGGSGVIIIAVAKLLGDIIAKRLTAKYDRDTQTALAQMQGQLNDGLSRLNSALQHQNFVLQRLSEIELNGIHACWRYAVSASHHANGVRPNGSSNDAAALQARIRPLADTHNTLLTLTGKYDPFLPDNIRTILDEVTRLMRLEIAQAGAASFNEQNWWTQGTTNRAAIDAQITVLRAAVKLRIVELRQLTKPSRQE
ncbi:MAG: hypothetical protein ABL986_22385 [Vicinamibacterales bacterium]